MKEISEIYTYLDDKCKYYISISFFFYISVDISFVCYSGQAPPSVNLSQPDTCSQHFLNGFDFGEQKLITSFQIREAKGIVIKQEYYF